MPWNPTIRDDRGRRVLLVTDRSFEGPGNDGSSRTRLARAKWGPTARPGLGEVVRGIAYGLMALPVLLIAALAPAYLAFRTPLPWWAQIAIASLIGVLPALVTAQLARRIAAKRIAEVYARAGFCASCGYDLEAIPEVDRERRCPECGSYWRTREPIQTMENEPTPEC